MCLAVDFEFDDKDYKPYFPNPYATLPVQLKNGSIRLMVWGRRQSQAGNLPLGGWARLECIEKGRWSKYCRKPVKLPVRQFAEKNSDSKMQWFEVGKGQFIQGRVARYDDEVRIYIVTLAPEDKSAIHNRWPRILSEPC